MLAESDDDDDGEEYEYEDERRHESACKLLESYTGLVIEHEQMKREGIMPIGMLAEVVTSLEAAQDHLVEALSQRPFVAEVQPWEALKWPHGGPRL